MISHKEKDSPKTIAILLTALILLCMQGVASAKTKELIPLYSWFSPSRFDNFTTSDPRWTGKKGDKKSPDYQFVRIEGMVYNPKLPQPPTTVPLYSWWSPSRKDNFITSDPRWTGKKGDTKSPDYKFVRIEGYITTSPNASGFALQSFFNPDRGDNFATTDPRWAGKKGDKRASGTYTLYRTEGYLPRPIIDTLGSSEQISGALVEDGFGVPFEKLYPKYQNIVRRALIQAPTHTINTTHIVCNAIQIHLVRQALWEDLLLEFGANKADLAEYLRSHQALAKILCNKKVNINSAQFIADQINKIYFRIDTLMASSIGLSVPEARAVRLARFIATYSEFSKVCEINLYKEQELLSSGPNLWFTDSSSSQHQQAWGICPVGGKSRGYKMDSMDISKLGKCIDEFIAQADNQCTDPVAHGGGDRSGRPQSDNFTSPTDPEDKTKIFDSGWKQQEDGSYQRESVWEGEDGQRTRSFESVREGEEHGATYERINIAEEENGDITSVDRIMYSEDGEINSYTHHDVSTMRELAEEYTLVGKALEAILKPFEIAKKIFTPPGLKQCRAFGGQSTPALGYFRKTDANKYHQGFKLPIGGVDVYSYCLCKSGKIGKDIAHSMGYGCSKRNARLECLYNPLGPTDAVRPECVKYLAEDHGSGVKLGSLCESIIQCPPTTQSVYKFDPEEALLCSCKGIGGMISGYLNNNLDPRCKLIQCPAAGLGSSAGSVIQKGCCLTLDFDVYNKMKKQPWSRLNVPLSSQQEIFDEM